MLSFIKPKQATLGLPNYKVLPFFAEQDLPMLRILTERGCEYCGRAETHDYRLYLAISLPKPEY